MEGKGKRGGEKKVLHSSSQTDRHRHTDVPWVLFALLVTSSCLGIFFFFFFFVFPLVGRRWHRGNKIISGWSERRIAVISEEMAAHIHGPKTLRGLVRAFCRCSDGQGKESNYT